MAWKPILDGKRGDVKENTFTLLAKFEDGEVKNWAIGYWGYHWLHDCTYLGRKWIHHLDMADINLIRTHDFERSLSQETLPLNFDPTHYMEIPTILVEHK